MVSKLTLSFVVQSFPDLPAGTIVGFVPTVNQNLPRGWLPCDGETRVEQGPWKGRNTFNFTFPNMFGLFGAYNVSDAQSDLDLMTSEENQGYVWIMKYW